MYVCVCVCMCLSVYGYVCVTVQLTVTARQDVLGQVLRVQTSAFLALLSVIFCRLFSTSYYGVPDEDHRHLCRVHRVIGILPTLAFQLA